MYFVTIRCLWALVHDARLFMTPNNFESLINSNEERNCGLFKVISRKFGSVTEGKESDISSDYFNDTPTRLGGLL